MWRTERRKRWTVVMKAGKEAKGDGRTRSLLIVKGMHVEAGNEKKVAREICGCEKEEKGRQGVM
jgi:hypothetical protein